MGEPGDLGIPRSCPSTYVCFNRSWHGASPIRGSLNLLHLQAFLILFVLEFDSALIGYIFCNLAIKVVNKKN